MSQTNAARCSRATGLVFGDSSPLESIVQTCTRIAASDATVLITGETGTGKEVFARLIHEQSRRAGRNLVPVNCGAIPESLLESELFGYVRGAFTGAHTSRKGRVALAEGGTLFLDEIGELPLSLQVKLLRLLQEHTYEPVGSNESVHVDFRLVAATNRDLAAEVEAGRFRRDLYYRLAVCPILLPPLRERRQDIVPLFRHFWQARGETRRIESAVLAALERYDWPGNVRELENLVERLSVVVEGPTIRLQDLPPEIAALSEEPQRHLHAVPAVPAATAAPEEEPKTPATDPAPQEELPLCELPPLGDSVDLPALLRTIEDRYIDAALARSAGNKKAAADLLGLQRTTLVEKLRRREQARARTQQAAG